MDKPISRNWIASLSAILVVLSITLMQAAPLTIASSSNEILLSPTSNYSTCFSNLNGALSSLTPLSRSVEASLLKAAESSSQYQAILGAGYLVSYVGYAGQYKTEPQCAGVVYSYAFNFVYGKEQIAIEVDPTSTQVLSTMIVPAVSWSPSYNSSSGIYGGGYSFYEGGTYTNPQTPYYFVEGVYTLPAISSPGGCSTGCVYGIWSGLSDKAGGNYIAQTGFAEDVFDSGVNSYWLWYQWAGYTGNCGPHPCTCSGLLNPGSDTILSATYSSAWVNSTGHTYVYNVNTYDPTTTSGCFFYHFDWSGGLGSNSYFAMLIGEKHQSLIPNFGRVGIQGTIYDNSGGPSGHCITTPYNNNDWVAWHNSYNGHTATENAVNSNCLFKDDYW